MVPAAPAQVKALLEIPTFRDLSVCSPKEKGFSLSSEKQEHSDLHIKNVLPCCQCLHPSFTAALLNKTPLIKGLSYSGGERDQTRAGGCACRETWWSLHGHDGLCARCCQRGPAERTLPPSEGPNRDFFFPEKQYFCFNVNMFLKFHFLPWGEGSRAPAQT